MNIYFIIYCGIAMLNLGIALANHGKPETGNENFFVTLIATIIRIALVYAAIKRGFWMINSHFHWRINR